MSQLNTDMPSQIWVRPSQIPAGAFEDGELFRVSGVDTDHRRMESLHEVLQIHTRQRIHTRTPTRTPSFINPTRTHSPSFIKHRGGGGASHDGAYNDFDGGRLVTGSSPCAGAEGLHEVQG